MIWRSLLSCLIFFTTKEGDKNLFCDALVVDVVNIHDRQGSVIACLSNEEDTFLTTCYLDAISSDIERDTIRLIFKDVPFGEFAISVFQDLNNNQALDRTRFSLPIEPFGFSNNPRLLLGPPSFKKCAFSVSERVAYQTIKLKRL